MNTTMNLTELAAAIAALSPFDRDTVFRMAYAQTVAPAAPSNSATLCVVRIAGRREIAEQGIGDVINVIKAVREATGLGLCEAKHAFDRGAIAEVMPKGKAEKIVTAATAEWRRLNRDEKSIWSPFSVVAAG